MPRNHQNQSSSNSSVAQIFSPSSSETTEFKSLLNVPYYMPKVQKPRRNKSAFLLFSSEKRAMLKASGENLNSNQMMAKLAELWNNISCEERRRYDMEAIQEKKRYLQEMEAFKKINPFAADMHNKTRKNHIKKPCSAYGIFVKEATVDIKRENPGLLMADVLKIVSIRWKSLNEDEKLGYQEKANVEKCLAREKLEDYYANIDSPVKCNSKKAKQAGEVRKQVKMDTNWFVDVNPEVCKFSNNFYEEQNFDLSPQENFSFQTFETSTENNFFPSYNFYPEPIVFQLTNENAQELPTPVSEAQEYDLASTMKFVQEEFSIEDKEVHVQNVLERFNSTSPLFNGMFNLETDPLMHDAFDLFDRIPLGKDSYPSGLSGDELEDLSLTTNCSFPSLQETSSVNLLRALN
jgi:hypothetical protein